MQERTQALWRGVTRAASRQLGLITRAQLAALGAGPQVVKRWGASGRMTRVQRDVFLTDGSQPGWQVWALSACLQSRRPAAISHWSAARLWGLDVGAGRTRPIHVSVPAETRLRLGDRFRVRYTTSLSAADRAWLQGLPVTTVSRTLVDLAPELDRDAVERAVDDALVSGLVTLPVLKSTVARMRTQGRSGGREVAAALQAWQGGLESHAEAAALRLLLSAGLPAPIPQHEIWVRGSFLARVDFAWPASRLALEVDGFQSHDGPRKFAADRERWNRLRAAGWDVLPVTLGELRRGSSGVMAVLREKVGV